MILKGNILVSEKKIEGLGGWLILVAIGVIISPVKVFFEVFPAYLDIFNDGSWEIFTTPGTDAYHIMWAPILLGEMSINLALVFVWLFIIFLFFSKKAAFPKWYISTLLFTLIFMIVDAFAIKLVLPNETVFDPQTVTQIIRTSVSCLIWIPYMMVSKRVSATFIRK